MPWEYFKKHRDHLPWESIHECKTITEQTGSRKKAEAILSCRDAGHLEDDGFVSFPNSIQAARGLHPGDLLSGGGLPLPEVTFPNGKKRSAEAMLEGKRPQLVLVVRAVHAHTGAPLPAIRPVASPPFHVATRRTKANEKAYIPSMDQEVPPPASHHPSDAPMRICCTRRGRRPHGAVTAATARRDGGEVVAFAGEGAGAHRRCVRQEAASPAEPHAQL